MSNDQQIVQRIATKALIVNEKGQCLILREANTYEEGTNVGRYHLPGGRLNLGEAFTDGLKREVDEEAGLEIEIGKPIYVGEWRPVIKGVQNQIVAIFFICKPLTSQVRLSEEHDDFQWVMPGDVSKFDIMSPENNVIQEYVTSLK
jgi:8-oxo-dGTP diphosphatase